MQEPRVRRQLKDQETSYIAGNIHQNCTYSCQRITAPALLCAVKRSDIEHVLGLEGQTVVTKGTHFLYTVVYSWLDTLQPVGFDDERYFFRVVWNLLIRHWWHWLLKRFPKTQMTFHERTSWGCILDELTSSFSFELCHKIRSWRTATHSTKHLELHVHYELWLKYFTCVKWRAQNHPPFSVKSVCFVSSCGVYALDDH